MLTKLEFHNVDNVNWVTLNSYINPIHDLEITVSQRTTTDRDKMEQHGVNSTRSLRGGMEIHIEGDIFGQDSADYWTNRKAILKAFFGDANVDPDFADRKLGTLVVGWDGESEDWEADCTITAFSAPIIGDSPSRSAYLVTFFAWLPYFIGHTSGNKYWAA